MQHKKKLLSNNYVSDSDSDSEIDNKKIKKKIQLSDSDSENKKNKKIKKKIQLSDSDSDNNSYSENKKIKKKIQLSDSDNKKRVINTNINNDDLIEFLDDIISKNEYVINCSSNSEREPNSLSYLVKCKDMSQSDCIKLGVAVEKVAKDIIMNCNKKLINIKEKNIKGQKETDHLFLDEKNKIIYYAELKSNANLDTEKSKSTVEKVKYIHKILKKKYKDHAIISYLVCSRYLTTQDMPNTIHNKYLEIEKTNKNVFVVGINEYFEKLNVNIKFVDYKIYAKVINIIVKKSFKV